MSAYEWYTESEIALKERGHAFILNKKTDEGIY